MALKPGSGEALVEVSGASVEFAGRLVLEAVDLTVRPGKIVTLIGPNGSGKTTLARLALGLLKPTRGSVRRRRGVRIGYVPQTIHIDETMPLTVRRFLALSGRPTTAEITEALDAVHAAHILASPIQSISGGEMKRALLARALLRRPDLLVLDEPSAGVDVTGQAELFELIDSIRKRTGCGILLVSHDLHLVMAATDEVLCLNRHVCCRGAPEAVTRHPEYLALFGGELAASMAVYAHDHDHEHDLSGETLPHGASDDHQPHERGHASHENTGHG